MNLLEKYPIEYSFDLKTNLPRNLSFPLFVRFLRENADMIETYIHPDFPDLAKSFAGDWTFAQPNRLRLWDYDKPIGVTTLYFSDLNDCLMAKLALV